MNATNYSIIKIRNETQNKFWVKYENHFLVLPDRKTVVGADASDWKKLIIEDITQGNPTQIGTHGCSIITLHFNSLTQSLLVGDLNDEVKQYQKKNGLFSMVKDYGKVGVDRVFSSTQVGRFAFFGGGDRSLVAIDICEQRLCPGRLKSPFLKTYSLQVCKGLGSKVYLSLGGYDPEYSSDKSDCMDVTLVYKRHKKESLKISKKMINVHGALREKNEIINSLSLKIKQLESFIQKQADESESTNNKRNPKSKKITSTAK